MLAIGGEKDARTTGTNFTLENFGTHFTSRSAFADKIIGAQVRGSLFEKTRKSCISLFPKVRSEFGRILQQNQTLIDLIVNKREAEYFLDGSKDPNRLLYLLDSGRWDIRVINITRNGISQTNSQRSRPHYRGTFDDAAREWLKTMKQIQRVTERVPSQKLHTVSYEELCSVTSNTLERIWAFLDLESIPCNPNNLDLKTKHQHILGNKMRTKSSITIKLDKRWQSQVTKEEYLSFENIAGHMNRKIGYMS